MKTIVISALIAVASVGCDRQSPEMIQPAEREYLESLIRIPAENPAAVAQYKRYYAVTFPQGRRTIKGLFVLDGEPGIYPVAREEDFPLAALDGGCDVVHIVYDAEAERILTLRCNGVA
jgi:hypothetical protein